MLATWFRRTCTAGSVVGIATFFACLLLRDYVRWQAARQGFGAIGAYIYAVNIGGTVDFITESQDRVLSVAVPGMWIGIVVAAFFAICHSLCTDWERRTHESAADSGRDVPRALR